MEQQIKDFRRRKRQEAIWNTLTLKGVMEKVLNRPTSPAVSTSDKPTSPSPPPPYDEVMGSDSVISDDNVSIASSNVSLDWSLSSVSVTRLQLATYVLYVVLWLTVLLIAVETGFGAVYLVISGLLGVYFNTRTGPKKEGEISAYSVFNPNCESIDGTLKAEHIEKTFNFIKH